MHMHMQHATCSVYAYMSLAGADDGDARVRRGGLTKVRVRVKVRVRESSGGLTKARLASVSSRPA